jgi:serine/threonine-protein phosphatase 4 regulatory subunit 1
LLERSKRFDYHDVQVSEETTSRTDNARRPSPV